MAARIPAEGRGLVRNDDAPATKEALRHFIPDRSTRLGRVALHLAENVGAWVDIEDLSTPEIGGRSADRRVRELDENFGWPIQRGKQPGKSTFRYKLTEDPRGELWKSSYAAQAIVR